MKYRAAQTVTKPSTLFCIGPNELGRTSATLRHHRGNARKVWEVLAATTIIAITAGTPMAANAQRFADLKTANSPLVLQAVGSFYVGGRTLPMSTDETGLYGGGPLVVDQMYVQYMIPSGHRKPPVVMIHGGTLSGKSYETTPDGRMGWYEYFARKGFPSYVVDQVARARSGFDQGPFNDVRAGVTAPASQPNLRRVASDIAWVRFRFGAIGGVQFEDSQFPVEAAAEFTKQTVPDQTRSFPPLDPSNFIALSELAQDLKGAVLIGHSQSGPYPFETALLNPIGIKALISIEPPGCKSDGYSAEQIAQLAHFPILIVFGDHLDTAQQVGPNWMPYFEDCKAFIGRVNSAMGKATMLHAPAAGIHGNSHMIMQDKNNTQIADLIIKWISSVGRGDVSK